MALSLSQTFWIKINKQKETTNSFSLWLPARFQGKRYSCTVYTAIQYSHYTPKSLSPELRRQKSDRGSEGECFTLAQSKEIEISISAMLFICNSNNFSLLNNFGSNWLCLQLNISFFPLANDFSSSSLKLKFSVTSWAVTDRALKEKFLLHVYLESQWNFAFWCKQKGYVLKIFVHFTSAEVSWRCGCSEVLENQAAVLMMVIQKGTHTTLPHLHQLLASNSRI